MIEVTKQSSEGVITGPNNESISRKLLTFSGLLHNTVTKFRTTDHNTAKVKRETQRKCQN